ncbi:Acylphosphatase [Porphyridium purpureum]|uniref:acylphosphatase n=1 Tax=Porphyridium purpureum TaxID=35688 RepID=A0A5J4YIK8_PORPP|nr:Acylphosphatase [Porphyridium purpureum]KAA8495513.1 Acylphosphatase [Porphyridium purpureum]|eukprot:POR5218..scf209_3
MAHQVKIVVRGTVQGVFFRDETVNKVAEINGGQNKVVGCVRNMADGSVYICALSEDKSALEELSAWAHHGPERAKVKKIEEEWTFVRDTSKYSDFTKLRGLYADRAQKHLYSALAEDGTEGPEQLTPDSGVETINSPAVEG